MIKSSRVIAGAALAASLGFAGAALAADPPEHGGGGYGGSGHGGGGQGGAPHGGMPQRGFHGAPANARVAAPRGGPAPSAPRYQLGRPGHDLGAFHGRVFSRFTDQDREQWRGGGWRHEEHFGHRGWWWVVGDQWFFYPQPIFPYPTYVGPDYWYDYSTTYPEPPYYWYYCEDPAGYYPYVQQCNVEWQPVPPVNP